MGTALSHHQGRALGLALALLVSLWFADAAATTNTPPQGLACPNGQTVWLRGLAAPGVSLIVRFDGRPVGGGSAGADGSWAIPMAVRERSGVYPVAVATRQEGATVAAFICYVDLPVGATVTPSPTPSAPHTPVEAASPGLPSATPQLLSATPTLSADPLAPSATPGPGETPAPTTPASTDPSTTVNPSSTAAPSATAVPTPSPPLPPEGPAGLALAAVQPDDPEEPGLFEYVVVENSAVVAQSLAGWRLIHRETGEGYAFPPLTIPAGDVLVLWSGDGHDDPTGGSLFWPATQSRWSPGQFAELVNPVGQVVSALLVPPPPTGATDPSPGTASRSYATPGGFP